MKRFYEEPVMGISCFDSSDVVTTSGEATGETAEDKAKGILQNNGVTQTIVVTW